MRIMSRGRVIMGMGRRDRAGALMTLLVAPLAQPSAAQATNACHRVTRYGLTYIHYAYKVHRLPVFSFVQVPP